MSDITLLPNGTIPFEVREQLRIGCASYIDGLETPYGYRPSLAAGIVFLVLFGLTMIGQTVQMIWKRTWWCAVFAIGSLTEVIGWAGRTWSAECPYNSQAFLMQITTLIIAPTFYTAGVYILLGRFIQILGRDSSVLSPRVYLWIFVTCDIVSLVIQAIGGGMASVEADKENGDTAPGTNIMVAGIVFQMASITVFVLCAADFVRRTLRRRLLQSMMGSIVPLLAAMIFSVICIYIRSIYRTIELLEGWDGYLITTERFFYALDGAMMVLAVGIFNFVHPGWFLPAARETFRNKVEVEEGSSTELRGQT
ncbi:RTA1 like protein-domain-containing protein [Aspergillus karnatakaensis]|uniref:RTA1 domain-containing protein n=1 Tax=Aspergillus karnatakaensis TaxID=1810916 RepID=UPI003CCE38FE